MSGTNRIRAVGARRRAVASVTAPKSFQPEPVLYCQVPLVSSTVVTAIALTALSSDGVSVMEPFTRLVTVSPAEFVLSSVIAVSVGVAAARTGASLTAVMLVEIVLVDPEIGLMPSFTELSTFCIAAVESDQPAT